MPTFARMAKQADETGLPVVEGFAVQRKSHSRETTVHEAVKKALDSHFPDHEWTIGKMANDWLVFRSAAEDPPSLGKAWEAVRALKELSGVMSAEPLLLTRLPVTNGSDAQRNFQLWGTVSDARRDRIKEQSNAQHKHWSLLQMGVCNEQGQGGAWARWMAKHPNGIPGEGILIAQPDTGYTQNARLLPHLEPHKDDPARHGRNFVERDHTDALDPMQDRMLGNFPGHGAQVASVMVSDHGPDDQERPWGVAPGAKILPLRVSSSVIHLSFQNVCDAFVEAIERGAHVISLSLGGPFGSELLHSLVRQALDKGILIVAAAGNYAPTVVFPARLPGVIACAVCNVLKAPWRFSGMGVEVAITAPGEQIWYDTRRIDSNGLPVDDASNGDGASFATANIAGLAALWLSYHGREALIQNHCGGRPELLPFLFRWCLQESANKGADFLRGGKGGFGAGIADADALLARATGKFPTVAVLADMRDKILSQAPGSVVDLPVSAWWNLLTLPTLTADGPIFTDGEDERGKRKERLERFLTELLESAAPSLDLEDRAELGALAGADIALNNALAKVAQGGRNCVSAAAVRRYLLRLDPRPGDDTQMRLSQALRGKLAAARQAAGQKWQEAHPELAVASSSATVSAPMPLYALPSDEDEARKSGYAIAPPSTRRLRAYAFDPGLATQSATASVNEITIPVVFERDLEPGPVGDYLEVVDVDPASDCVYAPVNLNHPFLLAQDGLPRSEGNPQFHQQMIYAVAMKTIGHFEEALGRPVFWASLRPWDPSSADKERADDLYKKDDQEEFVKDEKGRRVKDTSDQFVQRLRLYPHALREQNAYYSPEKRAILFGYFPAGDGDPGAEYPGGVVFTCLDHGIVSHETTHAILDGMHFRFTEPTNPDVFAFHEAFADIVALFQRFTYPELLYDQIARARGRLEAGTLMTRLALQFGQATGRHQALRDALGHVVRQARQKGEAEWRDRREESEMEDGTPPVLLADAARNLNDEETRTLWKRFQADPSLMAQVEEPHERGSFLVAAVFDAYLRIYEDRIADLKRIATGGTGVLPDGDLHPDLVNRMANEAAKSARHVLKMCIRAMDYVPPTDITFGEFLRALITADADLVPDDDRRYRVAFIEAFRKWGIYPRDVRTLSEETLLWSPPGPEKRYLFPRGQQRSESLQQDKRKVIDLVRGALSDWQPGKPRNAIFMKIKAAQEALWRYLRDEMPDNETKWELLGGIDTRRTFQVANLRPARRIGPKGEFLTEMVVEILQNKNALPYDPAERKTEEARRRQARQERKNRGEPEEPDKVPFRGGVTLIVSLDGDECIVRYTIYKRHDSASREARQRQFLLRAGASKDPDAAEYSSQNLPLGWYSDPNVRAAWSEARSYDREAMRASSCACRRKTLDGDEKKDAQKQARKAAIPVPTALTEPFALLHRG